MQTWKAGQRIALESPARGLALTSWFAPFTGGEEVTIPAREPLVVLHEPAHGSSSVTLKPVRYDALHPRFVSSEVRSSHGYAGYHLVVSFEEIDRVGARVVDE
jgi:hypothetical protein